MTVLITPHHDAPDGRGAAQVPFVIRRKLVPPPVAGELAPRPRIERQILRLLGRHRLILVTAAAGSGKTTAVATAVRQLKRPVAWLTIDRPDQAAGRLLTYVEASLARHVPAVRGVATGALSAGISHAEAAGLLAEALSEGPDALVIVLDELERLERQPEAWGVIEALLRYAPTGTSFLFVGRHDVPTRLCQLPSPDAVAVLSDDELAFTPAEAELALTSAGRQHADVAAVVEATAGWITGVMFESWRADENERGEGADTDLLYDYLSSQILDQVTDAERRFLVRASLLDEVTVARAATLGLGDASALMATLRTRHLPVVWAGIETMRYHPYFREYLQSRLVLEGEAVVRELRVAHGRRLVEEGHHEEATEEFMLAGELDEARSAAERCAVGVVERLDFTVAERWLAALGRLGPATESPGLVAASLLLAIGRDQISEGVALADAIAADIGLGSVPAVSERIALLMAWCYLHEGRLDAVDEILAAAGAGPANDAMRFARDALFGDGRDGPPRAPDPLPVGALGAIVCNAQYALGRIGEVSESERGGWIQAFERPWRTAALRARGHTAPALALYEQERDRGMSPAMMIFAGPDVLMDAGRWDDARELLRSAGASAAASGSLAFRGFCRVLTAKLELRGNRDPDAALAALAEPACVRACERVPFIGEVADVWRGLALLMRERPEEALLPLGAAVDGMVAGDRLLELPTACVYLAEARWWCADESGSEAAAERALDAARHQGSNHLLLAALADFPAVASRRAQGRSERGQAWEELADALRLGGRTVEIAPRPEVILHEFGRRAITVSGAEVKPRIAKSFELLARLTCENDPPLSRDRLLEALFDGRDDDSARAYLRQSVHRLREILPEGILLSENGFFRLAGVGVVSESALLEQRLAEAARLQGRERLDATLSALSIWDLGPYFPGARGGWVDARERHLAELTTEARYQAAVLAYGVGDFQQAGELLDVVVAVDRFREAAWRLAMRVAEARGDLDGVLRAYAGCERVLAEVGATPALATRELLARLRG